MVGPLSAIGRSSRAHDPVRGTLLTLLVTRILCVLVTSIESVSNELR